MSALNRAGGRRSPWTGETLEAAATRAAREHTNPAGCPHCPPPTKENQP